MCSGRTHFKIEVLLVCLLHKIVGCVVIGARAFCVPSLSSTISPSAYTSSSPSSTTTLSLQQQLSDALTAALMHADSTEVHERMHAVCFICVLPLAPSADGEEGLQKPAADANSTYGSMPAHVPCCTSAASPTDKGGAVCLMREGFHPRGWETYAAVGGRWTWP